MTTGPLQVRNVKIRIRYLAEYRLQTTAYRGEPVVDRHTKRVSSKLSVMAKTATAALLLSLPVAAWAVYPQKMVLTGDGANEIPSTSISFLLPDGSSVPVQEDDDGGLILIFPGDSAEPGTLVVTLPDGTTKSIPVRPPRPGDVLVVNVPRGTAGFRPDQPANAGPGAPPPVTVFIFGGYAGMDLPTVGAGTLITGGGEEFAAMLGNRVDIPFGGAGVAFPAGPGVVTIYGGYGEGSDRAANSTPAGGDVDVGIVFTDFAPSGSTGLFLGNAGLDTMISRDADVLRLGGVYSFPLGDTGPQGGFFGRVGVEYQRIEQSVVATVTSPTFGPAISATYTQNVDDSYVALILGGEYQYREPGGVFFATGVDGLLINRDADLDSRQAIICTVCAGDDRDFTVTIEDSDSGVTFGARARAEIGLDLGGNSSISVGGFVEYIDKVSQIVNPRTGDDLFVRNQPTAIGTQSATNYGGMVTLRLGL